MSVNALLIYQKYKCLLTDHVNINFKIEVRLPNKVEQLRSTV